jgi:protoporphyrinogen/coproporphyrinogen III oxidase
VSRRTQALVVGGGISGLGCAYALRKSGVATLLVEAAPRAGGVIRSERREGYLLELGPQSFSGTETIRQLCRELGLEKELLEAPANAPRYVLIDGKLQPVPLSPPAFLTSPLFRMGTKATLMRDALGKSSPPDADESIAAFVRRKFSAELLDKLVGPFISGIFAGDPEELSLRAAFPQVYEAEKKYGSVIRGMKEAAKSSSAPTKRPTLSTFRGGNETLVQALVARLENSLCCNTQVLSIRREPSGTSAPASTFTTEVRVSGSTETITSDFLILATPTNTAARLLSLIDSSFEVCLGAIEYASIAVVALGYPKTAVKQSLDGFGFLVPRSEKLRVLGSVWNSSLFAGRAPEGQVLLTSFIGGATDPAAARLPEDELAGIAHKDLASILNISDSPAFAHVEIYGKAIPQYTLGHSARITLLDRALSDLPNLKLIGNYLHGPAIGACIEQAMKAAAELSQSATLQNHPHPVEPV